MTDARRNLIVGAAIGAVAAAAAIAALQASRGGGDTPIIIDSGSIYIWSSSKYLTDYQQVGKYDLLHKEDTKAIRKFLLYQADKPLGQLKCASRQCSVKVEFSDQTSVTASSYRDTHNDKGLRIEVTMPLDEYPTTPDGHWRVREAKGVTTTRVTFTGTNADQTTCAGAGCKVQLCFADGWVWHPCQDLQTPIKP